MSGLRLNKGVLFSPQELTLTAMVLWFPPGYLAVSIRYTSGCRK